MVIFMLLRLSSVFMICGLCYGGKELSKGNNNNECQSKSMLGRDYRGTSNTTKDGIPCQRWNDTKPHDHVFTQEGEHNFCRNPIGAPAEQVFCYTTDPAVRVQFCSVPSCPPLKVLDFSWDNDMKPDENQEYTHASLDIDLPSTFTICSAFKVDFWEGYNTAILYLFWDKEAEKAWFRIEMFAALTFTKFTLQLADEKFTVKSSDLFYPLQWTKTCFSFDSNSSTVRFVVDGNKLVEKLVKIGNRPKNLTLILGSNGDSTEMTGKTTNLNIFSSAETVFEMRKMTQTGVKECRAPGDLLSWEEAEWILHSKARLIDIDEELEGPCRRESKTHVFPMLEYHWQPRCMELCEKLGGRSASVVTLKEWTNLFNEIQLITPNVKELPDYIWLSATEGDKQNKLIRPDHWPEGIEAQEGDWRDYYSGQNLDNYTKPWFSINSDTEEGDHSNCLSFSPQQTLQRSWKEWQCDTQSFGCPCSYETPPFLHFRGTCTETDLEFIRYTPMQPPGMSSELFMVGSESSQIRFDGNLSQWILRSPFRNVTATSTASQVSYGLGTQNWTIAGDNPACSADGQPYTREMKLTGCKLDEFTCSTGHCLEMEQRCDQIGQCEDKSDEMNCKSIFLENGYTKEIPPTVTEGRGAKTRITPVQVVVSMTLQKVVTIEEEEHSISFKFQISMDWKENRVTYRNLKEEWTINTVREEDVKMLWLPLVIYTNTDQQETTRLGEKWEWSTIMHVLREGDHSRNSFAEVEEAYVFKGEENSLRMEQIYTRPFQCVFKLSKYPFDTQVSITNLVPTLICKIWDKMQYKPRKIKQHIFTTCTYRSVTSIWASEIQTRRTLTWLQDNSKWNNQLI